MAPARKSKVDSEAAFLDAIRAAPDDDAPRLVYADYLLESRDEKKREYGEFIITQCDVAKYPRRTPEGQRAWSRECELEPIITKRKRYGAEKWERGFPVVICSTPDGLARNWKQLAPLPIRQVMLYDRNSNRVAPTLGELGWIARTLPQLQTIRFANNEAFVACDTKMLASLEEDDPTPAWPDGALPHRPLCDAVTVLHYNNVANAGGSRSHASFAAYIEEAFPKLESLSLRSMQPDGIMAMSNRPLKSLAWRAEGDACSVNITKLTHFDKLRELDVNVRLDEPLAEAIAATPLTKLTLHHASEAGLARFSPRPELEYLKLAFRDESEPAFATHRLASGEYPALEELHLERFASFDGPRFPELDYLELTQCIVDPKAMGHIGALGRFTLCACLGPDQASRGWSRSTVAQVDKQIQAAIRKRWPVAHFIAG